MIVHVSRDSLLDAVSCARKAVPNKDTLPILKNLAISASSAGLDLVGTNLEIGVRVRLSGCDTFKDGGIGIPAEPLLKVLGELPSEMITLEAKDFLLHISVEGSAFRSKIAGVDLMEFPEIPSVDGAAATTDKATLVRLISAVGFAVSHDTTRLALNGVCITRNRRHAIAVATDGHRLARLTANEWRFADDTGTGEWIVPTAAFKTMSGMSGDQISIRLADGCISMVSEPTEAMRCEVIAQLVSGPYPDWKRVIRPSSPHQIVFHREALQAALRRAIAVSKGPSPRIIVRRSDSGAGVVISSFGPQGLEREGTEIVAARIVTDSNPGEWSCNPDFLEELVALCPTTEVRIELGDAPTNPIHVIPCVEPCDQFFLTMPLRIDAKPEAKA